MSTFEATVLSDRARVAVTGDDAVPFLDNIATNALDAVPTGQARFSALLTPQGKILFEFFAQRTADGFALDTPADRAADLIKRLTMYRLRAKVTITDLGRGVRVTPSATAESYVDPRAGGLGHRAPAPGAVGGDRSAYDACRIALGVPEGGRDYVLGDTFPHEANYDLLHGVSFTKGCYVGQEVVARMQNKTVVRKRVVVVTGSVPLLAGTPILVGDAEIGRIGTVAARHGLAMLRLDRAVEAAAKALPLTAAGAIITPDAAALARYSKSLAERPVVDL